MILEKIKEIADEGWQVQSVWIVPPTSQISRSNESWEAHIKIADFVPGGEGDSDLVTIDRENLPDGVTANHREKMADQIVTLPAMSEEQAEAMACSIHDKGDASATHKTASGCWSIGPTAAWCKDPLRRAIIKSRKK